MKAKAIKSLIFIGNGFDVAHGYKTRFKDFYENRKKELLFGAENGNALFRHIIDRITEEYWKDLEKGLYDYSIELTNKNKEGDCQSAKQFEKEFIELKKLLFDYLQSPPKEELKDLGWKIKALSDEWLKLDSHVVSFNYTYLASACTNSSKNDSLWLSFDPKEITYQHGMISNPLPNRANTYEDIVVGIDETQKVEELHSFLYKTSQKISSVYQLTQKIREADVFIIYGCSMGDSDRFYFKSLFDKRRINKRYIVYGYGEEEKKRLQKIMNEYIGELNVFQDDFHNNEIKIIDSSGTKAIKETEEYINSILNTP